jgi:hypothetical protein
MLLGTEPLHSLVPTVMLSLLIKDVMFFRLLDQLKIKIILLVMFAETGIEMYTKMFLNTFDYF